MSNTYEGQSRTIFAEHGVDLEKSGLSTEMICRAKLYSLNRSQAKAALGFLPPGVESVLGIPYGQSGFVRFKLFPPGKDKLGKKTKYLQARNSGVQLYVPPGIEEALSDISIPLIITEGEKKGLKAVQEGLCCVALGGVNNWKLRGAEEPIAAIRAIPLNGRVVRIAHDSDFKENVRVLQAVYALGRALELLGAKVEAVCLPHVNGGAKVGLDDFLAANPVSAFESLPRIALSHETFQEAIKQREPEWEAPIPFHHPRLPVFPIEALAPWLRAFVGAEAEATQTPVDLAAMLSLAVLAAACAKKVKVLIRRGYTEPVNLFTIAVLGPGNRKSAVFAEAAAPIEAYEESEYERTRSEICEAAAFSRIAEQELRYAEANAAKATADEREVLQKEAGAKAIAHASIELPAAPRMLADDTTPEKLATLLSEQGGRMAVMSPEGDIFEIMAGRYSGAPNFAVYLKGHAGDTLRVDRVGRPSEYVKAPALTLGLAVQPDVISGLLQKPSLRGRGLLARFLYSLPPSPIGRRRIAPEPMADEIRAAYRRRISSLLTLPSGTDSEGQVSEHIIRLSEPAVGRFAEFEAWLEPQLGPLEEMGLITDWASKHAGAVARIAGLLHMAENVESSAPWETAIGLQTLERAIQIGEYLIPHAHAAFSQMGADPAIEGARLLLVWITRRGLPSLTKRDMFNGTRGRFRKSADLDPVLRLLIEHGYLRLVDPVERPGAGRKPSPVYQVNPDVLPHNPHNTHNDDGEDDSADSAETAGPSKEPATPTPGPSQDQNQTAREVVKRELAQQAEDRVGADWVEGTHQFLEAQHPDLYRQLAVAQDRVDQALAGSRDTSHEVFTTAIAEWESTSRQAIEVMRHKDDPAVPQDLFKQEAAT